MKCFDTHCHLQFSSYDSNRESVIKTCFKKEVVMNVVGTQAKTSRQAVELAEKYEKIYATVGLHPIHENAVEVKEETTSFISLEEKFDYEFYKKLANNPKVIAIGETGLDKYHIPKNLDQNKILEQQKSVFLLHYKLAKELGLPMVIHVREAHDEMIEFLKSLNAQINGVMHCFSGNLNQARQYISLGLYIGFTGVITFPPKKTDPKSHISLLEVVKNMPENKILVETDAPFLAPQNYRGQRCEPWMVEDVIAKVAEIRGIELKKMNDILFKNALNLFCKVY
jgi:TatD DNase family protein